MTPGGMYHNKESIQGGTLVASTRLGRLFTPLWGGLQRPNRTVTPVGTDKTCIPDLPKGTDNYRFGWIRDTLIRLQIQRNEPCNLSTMNPLVINLAAARLTSPRKLTLAYESKNTSKCTEKQPNHRKQLIQLTSGVPQPKNGVLFLTEMN
jgi:hypothetical protein